MGVDHISAAAHQPIPTEPSSRDNVDNTDPKKQVADAGDTGVKVEHHASGKLCIAAAAFLCSEGAPSRHMHMIAPA